MTAPADPRRTDAAARRVRLAEDPSLAHEPGHADWLADPANRARFDQADAAWDLFDELGAAPEMIAIRREALGDARRAARSRWAPGLLAGRAAAAVLVGGICAALLAGAYAGGLIPSVYSTGVGERRIVMLKDGSRLSLDAASEVQVRYSAHARSLKLERGQARFDVAHDTSRPFTVHAGDRTVVATGTAFNVDLLGREVLVTLIEGHVVVKADRATPTFKRTMPMRPSVALQAGQQMLSSDRAAPRVSAADLRGVTAWERGQLVFDDEPLSEAVMRVNRYASHEIVVDPSAASVRVSGAFDAGNTASFIDAMTSYFPLDQAVGPDQTVTLRKRS